MCFRFIKSFALQWRMNRRIGIRKTMLACVILLIILILLKVLFHTHIDPADESFTNINTCPACYGKTSCPDFIHGHVNLLGGSKLKFIPFYNRKNVYYGRTGGHKIVLKKLAHNWEFKKADQELCELANLDYCDVSAAVPTIVSTVAHRNDMYFTRVLNKFCLTTDFTACPSERLLSHVYTKLTNGDLANKSVENDALSQMMYSIYINPESVILQSFSQNEGWPFPQFKGSCGRVIVEEYVGYSLLNYEDSSWNIRLDLSYQLLQIAQQLSENSMGFAFYMTDVTMDNFAVRSDGTLLLVDVENIVVVDRFKIREDKAPGWNHLHRSKGEACRDCLSFSYEDLCKHDMSDHNFYAVCKGIIVPHAYYSNKGLLHSIPADIEERTNLSALISECADPVSDIGRFVVVPKLLQVMKSLL